MTKIFSAVFFAVFLIATWYVTHNRPAVSYETHSDMQATMVQVITQYLAKEKPNAKDFSILELKSEVITPNSVRVVFQYQFREADINGSYVTVQRSGAAEMMKAAAQDANNPEMWEMRKGKIITSEGLVFEDALRVVPGAAEVFNDVPTDGAIPAVTPTPSAEAETSGQ